MSIIRHNPNSARLGKTRNTKPLPGNQNASLSRFRRRIEQLSQDQEEISADRVQLMEERERYIMQGKEVNRQRIRTTAAEVRLMNAFRQAFNDSGFQMPPYVIAAFQEVQEERDKLGPIDRDHLEANENIGGLEYILSEKEDRLYQEDFRELLLDDPSDVDDIALDGGSDSGPPHGTLSFEPSSAVRYQAAVAELRQLVVRFDRLRRKAAELADEEGSHTEVILPNIHEIQHIPKLIESASTLVDAITTAQLHVQHLRQDILESSGHTPLRNRRRSDPAPLTKQKLSIGSFSRAQSEGSVPDVLDNPPVEQRVQDWLEDVMESNWSVYKRIQYVKDPEIAREQQGISNTDLSPQNTHPFHTQYSSEGHSIPPEIRQSHSDTGTTGVEYQPENIELIECQDRPEISSTSLIAITSFKARAVDDHLRNLDLETRSRSSTKSSRTIPGGTKLSPYQEFQFTATSFGEDTASPVQESLPYPLDEQIIATNGDTGLLTTQFQSSCDNKIDSCQTSQAEGRSRSPSFRNPDVHTAPESPHITINGQAHLPLMPHENQITPEASVQSVPILTFAKVDQPEVNTNIGHSALLEDLEILRPFLSPNEIIPKTRDYERLYTMNRPRSRSSQSRPRSVFAASDTLWRYGSILRLPSRPHKRWKSTSDIPSDCTVRVLG